jgi:hypothetical protein
VWCVRVVCVVKSKAKRKRGFPWLLASSMPCIMDSWFIFMDHAMSHDDPCTLPSDEYGIEFSDERCVQCVT